MEKLLRNWNIGDIRNIDSISSYRGKTSLIKTVDGQSYILKEKSDLIKMEKESTLLLNLSKVGAPVAVPIRTENMRLYALSNGRIFCLYPKLPGEIVSEHYDGNAILRAETLLLMEILLR